MSVREAPEAEPTTEEKPTIFDVRPPTIPLDERFSEYQLTYLEERRDTYRASTANERKELCQHTVEHFIKEIEKTGRTLEKPERNGVGENVRTWYAQRGRSRNDLPTWTVHWTARQCFYRENMEKCKATWKELQEQALGRRATSEELDLDQMEDQDEDTPEPGGEGEAVAGNKAKPFSTFQAAISAEMAKLTDKEREKYEKMAIAWREHGPTAAEKKRLAEKNLRGWVRQFAKDVYNQMGARIVFLTVTMDFNFELGGGRAFKPHVRSWWEKSDVEGVYGRFVQKDMPLPPGEDEEGQEDQPKSNEVVLSLNKFGEPIIPNPENVPSAWKAHKYYVRLVRLLVKGFYACAKGVPLSKRSAGPPWNSITKDRSQFVADEYLPDDFGAFEDPNIMGVEKNQCLLRHWYSRQEAGLVPLRFHQYLIGTAFTPSEPRTVVSEPTTSESESATPPPAKRPTRKAAAKHKKDGAAKSKKDAANKSQDAVGADPGHQSEAEEPKVKPKPRKKGAKPHADANAEGLQAGVGGEDGEVPTGTPTPHADANAEGLQAGVGEGGEEVPIGEGIQEVLTQGGMSGVVPTGNGGESAAAAVAQDASGGMSGIDAAVPSAIRQDVGTPSVKSDAKGDIEMLGASEDGPVEGVEVGIKPSEALQELAKRRDERERAKARGRARLHLNATSLSGPGALSSELPKQSSAIAASQSNRDSAPPTPTSKLAMATSALTLQNTDAIPGLPSTSSPAHPTIDMATAQAVLALLQTHPNLLNMAKASGSTAQPIATQAGTPAIAPSPISRPPSDVEMDEDSDWTDNENKSRKKAGKQRAQAKKGKPKGKTAQSSSKSPRKPKNAGATAKESKEDKMLVETVEKYGRSGKRQSRKTEKALLLEKGR
ncbi:hypothetical protein DFP72DRAFT_859704 [Ephemerocybe angulata]|uniref:Uncharacterized protein n=1 Tax=Ephemerocybe angulata TaxID=980116 RepID=A0A8H6HB97_9AGAR|nr:hypothetical protein DFP72DRAFT_859704 [Tulosesus angulatus]